MKLLRVIVSLLLATVLVFGATSATVDVAVTCEPTQLMPCLKSIMNGTPPPSTCCSKLKQQKPCMCGYINNPKFANRSSPPLLLPSPSLPDSQAANNCNTDATEVRPLAAIRRWEQVARWHRRDRSTDAAVATYSRLHDCQGNWLLGWLQFDGALGLWEE
ncbi:hypothetical protein R6Q59_013925 [Mikania micrantha]